MSLCFKIAKQRRHTVTCNQYNSTWIIRDWRGLVPEYPPRPMAVRRNIDARRIAMMTTVHDRVETMSLRMIPQFVSASPPVSRGIPPSALPSLFFFNIFFSSFHPRSNSRWHDLSPELLTAIVKRLGYNPWILSWDRPPQIYRERSWGNTYNLIEKMGGVQILDMIDKIGGNLVFRCLNDFVCVPKIIRDSAPFSSISSLRLIMSKALLLLILLFLNRVFQSILTYNAMDISWVMTTS
jgi:hypothetical protein